MNNWANGQFEFLDLLLAPIYILIIVVLFYAFSPKEKEIKKYFVRGLLYKILGGIIFWFVHCCNHTQYFRPHLLLLYLRQLNR